MTNNVALRSAGVKALTHPKPEQRYSHQHPIYGVSCGPPDLQKPLGYSGGYSSYSGHRGVRLHRVLSHNIERLQTWPPADLAGFDCTIHPAWPQHNRGNIPDCKIGACDA